ncbi:EAL domain-containing protein [Anaerobacillus sp. HL2]|nr:EAL domain-containing protein [Anaerobacillus sp. HL2]
MQIAVDDFGTGYSSLSYLKIFPISTLKIDQTFVYELPEDKGDRAIVSSIINLAQNLTTGNC